MTLYSENKKLKLERDKAIRALDEIQQWLNDEVYNKGHTGEAWQVFDFTRIQVNDYRKKYGI